jgi:hypothetical protein
MCPPPACPLALAHVALAHVALAHVALAHVAQGWFDTFGKTGESGFVDGETAEDRARRVTVQPARSFTICTSGVANGY